MGKLLGRPPKDIDKKSFEKLCGMQATLEEVCAFFDVSDRTLDRWCNRTYGATFFEVFKAKRGLGKVSLRRSMWQGAEKGNTALLIFLAKNHLGMSDSIRTEVSAEGRLADLIEGLKEPDDIHEETAGADAAMAEEQP